MKRSVSSEFSQPTGSHLQQDNSLWVLGRKSRVLKSKGVQLLPQGLLGIPLCRAAGCHQDGGSPLRDHEGPAPGPPTSIMYTKAR